MATDQQEILCACKWQWMIWHQIGTCKATLKQYSWILLAREKLGIKVIMSACNSKYYMSRKCIKMNVIQNLIRQLKCRAAKEPALVISRFLRPLPEAIQLIIDLCWGSEGSSPSSCWGTKWPDPPAWLNRDLCTNYNKSTIISVAMSITAELRHW